MMLLGTFHWIVDVKGWHKWALPFTVIGMNSILIYMLSEIIDFGKASGYFLGGLAHLAPDHGEQIGAFGSLLAKIGLLYFLYRQKLYFRV